MIAYGAHPAQFAELSLPAGTSLGTVVIIHGGFWRASYDLSLGRPLAADLTARGYTVWNIEYRRVGAGGGWPHTLLDVAAAVDHLADLDVDTSRVIAVGHSAGGHLATWAAGRHRLAAAAPGAAPRVRLAGVVSQAGVLSLATGARAGVGRGAIVDLLGAGPAAAPERYAVADPIAAAPLNLPVVCLHSRRDGSVPFEQSVDYVQAANGFADLVETSGDHFTLIDPAHPDWSTARGAVERILTRRP